MTLKRKTRIFRDRIKPRASRQGQSPEHSRQKFWKIYLSVFRDWKFYPQESRKVSRENLWVPSRLDLPLANKSPDWVMRNIKRKNLKNIPSIFRDWDIDPLVSCEKSLCGLATRTCDWTNPQLSRQNKATFLFYFIFIFKFWHFCKNKRLSKNN